MSVTTEPLPESLMMAIRLVCESDMPMPGKFKAAVLITTGYGLWVQAETVDPTAYAMPTSQWEEIAGLLLKSGSSTMDWLNVGPSAYRVTE